MKKQWKIILQLAWPLIIANSFWNLQLTIDRIYLGMLSTEALGAAMAVMGVFWVPMALLQQTSGYITTFVAQYFGANEKEKIGEATWQAIFVAIFGGILFLFLQFLTPWFFDLVGHAVNIQRLEIEYFNSVAYTALPTALVAIVSGFYTGLGQTRRVIGINFVGLILNVFLDYVMIFGKFGFPALGIAGAGYATAIATYGAAAYGLFLLFQSEHELKYKIYSSMRVNWILLKQFLKFGIPSGLQWALEGLAFTVFLILMGRMANGEAALASSSIAVTVMMLSVLPSMGVAQAVMTLVGQNLGEKNPAKAELMTWSGVQVSLMYMSVVAFTFFVFPEFYLSWFTNVENPKLWTEVSAIVPQLLKIVALFTIFDSAYLNISFALKGAGDTRFVSIVALIIPWPLMVLPTYLTKDWDNAVIWAWWFAALYSLTVVSILLLRFRQGRWKSMSVIH
ncbi:MAG TPA: MATE family efflux transporter [Pseudobdellovibrionaceae bacterium]|nr:MATE family efflux transporter [Pseudobdellovibrionaceae bacterium]